MLQLTIDKASVTFTPRSESTIEAWAMFAAAGKYYYSPSRSYRHTAQIDSGPESSVLLQWGGQFENMKGRARIEFNPNKLEGMGAQTVGLLPAWIKGLSVVRHREGEDGEFIPVGREWIYDILVTRLDFAIDIPYAMSEIDIEYRTGVSRTYYIGKDGQLETLYLGANSSDKVIRIYDKARQMGKAGLRWIRVEQELRGQWPLGVLEVMPLEMFADLRLSRRQVQQGICLELVPLRYRALLFYLEHYPTEATSLTRTEREKIAELRRQVNEPIDLDGIVRRDYRPIMDKFIKMIRGY